jgi:gliding motility-associated-like protein
LEDVHWTKLVDTVAVVSPGNILQVKPAVTTTYRVSGKNCGLFVSDTITVFVNPLPATELGADTTICAGTQLKLDAGVSHAEYHWSNGSQDRFSTISKAGSYTVTVKNEFGCSAADVIRISTLNVPVVNLGRDTTLCETFYQLNAGGNHDKYEWSTGSQDSVLLPTEVGTYWVTVTNQCGVAKDTITLHSYNRLSIPNVITPNNDQLNDYLQVGLLDTEDKLLREVPLDASIKILNRWGKEVFSASQYKNNWPLAEDEISTGTYYYEIITGNCRNYKGWVQVIK